MTPASILKQAKDDGVSVVLSPSGVIKAIGTEESVNRWLPLIRQNKPGIRAVLQESSADVRKPEATLPPQTASSWMLTFLDGTAHEVYFPEDVTSAYALASWPGSVTAGVVAHSSSVKPDGPLTSDEELSVLSWLDQIAEFDLMMREVVLTLCRTDDQARAFYLAEARSAKVAAQLEADPSLTYAMKTSDDPNCVLLTIAVRDKGIVQLRIPESEYDGIRLLELIEQHTRVGTLQ